MSLWLRMLLINRLLQQAKADSPLDGF